MKEKIITRLTKLRALMKEKNVDALLVPTDDFHSSEYVGDYFKCREYITGFTGSAGTAIIMQDMAGLWTDGRYFIQAAKELRGTGITLFKMGEMGVPTIHEFLGKHLKKGQTLAFDGRTVGAKEVEQLEKEFSGQGITIDGSEDFIGSIWEDRPALPTEPVFELDVKWCGKSRADKCREVRDIMKEKGADVFVLSSLDDIAWLLNIRGNDVTCNPVVLSYLIMTRQEIRLFAGKKAFPATLSDTLQKDGVTLYEYSEIEEHLRKIPSGSRVLLCKGKVNSRLVRCLPAAAEIIDENNPTELLKAVKNPVEIKNEKIAHIKDGVAVTRFLYWLKTNVGKENITEISAAEKLYELRAQQEHFMGESFAPILAYGPHGAIVHYSATPQTDVPLEPHGLLLADTGAHYLEGTTDITRTIALGPVTEEEKKYFTAVLRGHLHLADARFLYGCRGANLDYLAREPLWRLGKDYNHGTGHGVGYFLNVHEGPNAFRWKVSADNCGGAVFEEGMITSNEPGYYEEGQFGIRHENLMVCCKAENAQAGQMLCFQPLTMVPFDLDAIAPEQMSEYERELLNRYHHQVYEAIAPYLSEKEKQWLRHATREI